MAYTIQYVNKKGGHVTQMTTHKDVLEKKILSLFKQRIEAVVFQQGGETIGRVWKDNSQRVGWNWFLDIEPPLTVV